MGEICDSRKDWDNIKKQSCTSNEHFGINTDSSNEVGQNIIQSKEWKLYDSSHLSCSFTVPWCSIALMTIEIEQQQEWKSQYWPTLKPGSEPANSQLKARVL